MVRNYIAERNSLNIGIAVGIVLILALLPLGLGGGMMELFIRLFLFISLVASWNVMSYTGYINFGHIAFYGTGAYVVGLGITIFELPIIVAVLLAGVLTGLLGLGLGVITMRVRGHYFAIASLMLLFIMTIFFTNIGDIIPGASMEVYFRRFGDLSLWEFRSLFYYLFLVYSVALILFSIYLEQSKYGYGMRAIGSDEDLALSLGINTTYLKNVAITISAFTCGIIGATHALFIQYIDPSLFFSVSTNFLIVFMGFIGGFGVWAGPIIGAGVFIPLDEWFTVFFAPELAQIVFGGLFVVIILLRPDGLAELFAKQIKTVRQDGISGLVDQVRGREES